MSKSGSMGREGWEGEGHDRAILRTTEITNTPSPPSSLPPLPSPPLPPPPPLFSFSSSPPPLLFCCPKCRLRPLRAQVLPWFPPSRRLCRSRVGRHLWLCSYFVLLVPLYRVRLLLPFPPLPSPSNQGLFRKRWKADARLTRGWVWGKTGSSRARTRRPLLPRRSEAARTARSSGTARTGRLSLPRSKKALLFTFAPPPRPPLAPQTKELLRRSTLLHPNIPPLSPQTLSLPRMGPSLFPRCAPLSTTCFHSFLPNPPSPVSLSIKRNTQTAHTFISLARTNSSFWSFTFPSLLSYSFTPFGLSSARSTSLFPQTKYHKAKGPSQALSMNGHSNQLH